MVGEAEDGAPMEGRQMQILWSCQVSGRVGERGSRAQWASVGHAQSAQITQLTSVACLQPTATAGAHSLGVIASADQPPLAAVLPAERVDAARVPSSRDVDRVRGPERCRGWVALAERRQEREPGRP